MRRGNVFFIIIAVLAIIFTMMTFFIKDTMQEKNTTQYSQRVAQTECLAEAIMERAMIKLKKELNDPENCKDKNSLACFIRTPMTKNKSSFLGDDTFGKDYELNIPEEKKIFVLSKEDLEGDLGSELTDAVKFMAGEKADFNAEVQISLVKSYGIGPGPSVIVPDDFRIAGVDMPWNINESVMKFLNNDGFSALTLEFPDGLQLFDLKINLLPGADALLGTKKITSEGTEYRDGGASTEAFKNPFEIDVMKLLATFAEKTSSAGDQSTMSQILEKNEISKLLQWMSDTFETMTGKNSFYPLEIKLAKSIFPPISGKAGYTMPSSIEENYATEKYGFLEINANAAIIYPDKQVVFKSVKAEKEFKCADIEPVAPLYSFFINNTNNEYLNFNSVGGNLTINNFSSLNRITGSGKSSDPEKTEFPGLVRVNGTENTVVNVGFIGNPLSNSIDSSDNSLKKMGKSAEWALVLDHKCKNAAFGASTQFYDAKEKINDKYRSKFVQLSNTQIAKTKDKIESKGAEFNPPVMKPPQPAEEHKTNFKKTFEKGNLKADVKGGLQKLFGGFLQPNILPPLDKDKLGVYFFEPPIHFAKDYMKNESGVSGMNIFNDSFVKWEWPVSGFGFDQFRIPIPTVSETTTQLFGFGSAYPTLTKGIEGNVLKRIRQWHLGIMSFPCLPPPFGKQIPTPWGPLLPIWFPVWHTHDIENKYEYALWLLKETLPEGDMEIEGSIYDPTQLANHPPNLYSVEQYAKKASFYYATAEDFYADLKNRTIKENGKDCLNLSGITYIEDSVILPPPEMPELCVAGKGAIVTGGNFVIQGDIKDAWNEDEERKADTPRTIFSLIARKGGLIVDPGAGPASIRLEGSIYTEKGMSVPSSKGVKIVGNYVTNAFCKLHLMGEVLVEYVAYKTRSSLTSVNPDQGVYDPDRYLITLSPGWSSWKLQ